MSDALTIETIAGSLVVTFTRPKIRNPLSISVLESLDEVVGNVVSSVSIDTIIFTGKDDVFASGADLREIAAVSSEDAKRFALRGQQLMNKIVALPQTTIAAINGYCFGGALDLALACERRTASPSAKFAHPGAGLGIITGWGGTQRLPRLVGSTHAMEIFFTASPIDAERAFSIGLIDEIAEDPMDAALKFVG